MSYETIYAQFISLNLETNQHFLSRYLKLAFSIQQKKSTKQLGFQNHHIFPRAFGGKENKENMVMSSGREHFILHWLLARAFPSSTMVVPFFGFCHGWNRDYKKRIHSREFERLQKEVARQTGERFKENVGEKNHFFGKHHSEETKKIISEANKGRPGPNLGKHLSEETKEKLSEKAKIRSQGEGNSMFGRTHSDETKLKMSEKKQGYVPWNVGIGHTEDTCSKIKDVLKEKNQFKVSCLCCRKELLPRLFHRHLAGSNCKAFIE